MDTLPHMARNAPPRPAAYAVALVALLVGGWFGWSGWRAWTAYATVDVGIVSSRVDTTLVAGRERIRPVITYRFAYGGITQTSSTLKRGNPAMSEKESASWVRLYPAGLETVGYLSTDNPDDIVLVRDRRFVLPGVVALGGLVALVLLFLRDRAAAPKPKPSAVRTPGAKGPGAGGARPGVPGFDLTPPPGMEDAVYDPTPGPDGFPRGWVRPER